MGKGPSLFFMNFQGEFLSILLDKETYNQVSDGEQTATMEAPIRVQAYLVDEDDTFLFLGDEPNVTDRAIPKSRVLYVEIVKTINDALERLKEMDMPDEDKAN